MERPSGDVVLMIVDALTKEAIRIGDDPKESGPLFFTTRERLEAYAEEEDLDDYAIYEVPAGVLSRMKGKPHWVDGRPGR